MAKTDATEITTVASLASLYFFRRFLKEHLFHKDQLRNRISDMKVQQRTATQNRLVFEWHNVRMFAVPPAERVKYCASVALT